MCHSVEEPGVVLPLMSGAENSQSWRFRSYRPPWPVYHPAVRFLVISYGRQFAESAHAKWEDHTRYGRLMCRARHLCPNNNLFLVTTRPSRSSLQVSYGHLQPPLLVAWIYLQIFGRSVITPLGIRFPDSSPHTRVEHNISHGKLSDHRCREHVSLKGSYWIHIFT